jgi:hypothetical protein
MKGETTMNRKFLYIMLLAIAGVGLLAGFTLTKPISEPATMFFLGTGLIGIAGIFKKEND